MDLLQLSGSAIARHIKHRDFTAEEVMEATLMRAQALQAHINPFVTIDSAKALLHAKHADQLLQSNDESQLPALHGVPFSVKDLLDTGGVRTTYGSRALADHIPEHDIAAVARLRHSGAILFAKTTTSEFASKVTTDCSLTGTTRNPWNVELTAGGSSGGSGAAIASGAGALAISTDGGGSARIPASVCGVLGLKVTIGAIPHESWPFHYGNNSSISMNCRHPEDLISMFNSMRGAHRFDPWSRRQIPSLRIPEDPYAETATRRALYISELAGVRVDPALHLSLSTTLKRLSDTGLTIEVASGDPLDFDPGIALQMILCNLAARMRSLPTFKQSQLDPLLQSLVNNDKFRPDGVRIQADAIERSRIYDKLERLFSTYDYILSPTLKASPPSADANENVNVVIDAVTHPIADWWSHLSIANLTGHPAISVPCGFDTLQLPVGLHAVAGWDKEQALIDLAYAMQTGYDWTATTPPDCA